MQNKQVRTYTVLAYFKISGKWKSFVHTDLDIGGTRRSLETMKLTFPKYQIMDDLSGRIISRRGM